LAYYALAVVFWQVLLPGRVRVKILAVIPARYESTRLPGKVLTKDTGKFLIQHTYERVCAARLCDRVLIAADDERMKEACGKFGAECVLTSREHKTGTDRIAEAAGKSDADIVVNVQADEPEIEPANIDLVAKLLVDNADFPMSTLVTDFEDEAQIADGNIVKVVVGADGRAIYFSRAVIPYDRDSGGVGAKGEYLRHVGIYAYRRDFLCEITSLAQRPLEKAEKLEQLRAIEYGYSIMTGKVEHNCEGIDTPGQYAEFVKRYKKQQKQK